MIKSDAPRIERVMPTHDWKLVIEFAGGDFRLFKVDGPATEKGYDLSNPMYVMTVRHTADGVRWAAFETFDSRYLHERSTPLDAEALRWQHVSLGMANQAPTEQHVRHHVYGVTLSPFHEQPVALEQSIGGGLGDRGGAYAYSFDELVGTPKWKEHFKLSACEWVIPIIEGASGKDSIRLSWHIVDQLKRRTRRVEKPHRAPRRRSVPPPAE